MKHFVFGYIFLFCAGVSAKNCFPGSEFIASSKAGDGAYLRVHPSGNYLLYSVATSRLVEIVDLTRKNQQGQPLIISTSMTAETAPVEGRWEFLAAPRYESSMSYFSFQDFLDNPEAKAVKPIFTDSEHNDYYHSSAELPGGESSNYTFRTTLFQNGWTRDYSVVKTATGKKEIKPKGKRYHICSNIFSSSANDKKPILTQPVLSKDGTLIAGLPTHKTTTHVYRIKENGDCDLVKDIGVRTWKVNFSYPEKNKLPMLTYSASGNAANNFLRKAYIYDLESSKSFALTDKDYESDTFPGFTKDGRVIYRGYDAEKRKGYFRVDALKIVSSAARCAERTGTPDVPQKAEQKSSK